MGTSRASFGIIKLTSGDVLAIGGVSGGTTYLSGTEIYSQSGGTWSSSASMANARSRFVPILLGSGDVLASGGYTGINVLTGVELYQ
jgi:hypothetical protein